MLAYVRLWRKADIQPGRLGEIISEVGGQISGISLNHRPETGSTLTSGSSIPASPASQSVLFMANAKRGNFSRVSGQLGDTKIQQSTKGADFAPENRRLGTPVSGSHFSIS